MTPVTHSRESKRTKIAFTPDNDSNNLEEASTHKSAKTHATRHCLFVPSDVEQNSSVVSLISMC